MKEASDARTLALLPTTQTHDLEKSETAQITIRDTKDCLYLYVPSRVAKQAIGPRITRSWLKHLD